MESSWSRAGEIDVPADYSFAHVLERLPSSPLGLRGRVEEGEFRIALRMEGDPVVLRVRADESGRRLTVWQAGRARWTAVDRLVRRIFCLHASPDGPAELAARDAVAGALLSRTAGLRPVLLPEPYESLVWAIVGQQVNVPFARKLYRALLQRAAERLWVGETPYFLAPRPEEVATLRPEDLTALQFSRQKARCVVEISREMADGVLSFAALEAMTSTEAAAWLTQFKGIGRWTAENLLLRGLGRMDVLPAGDVALQQEAGAELGLAAALSEQELRARAECWGDWRGWLALMWWMERAHRKAQSNQDRGQV